eukprot:COSAG02_NODE_12073_length_1602_cov_3.656687_1_plen_103_part_00
MYVPARLRPSNRAHARAHAARRQRARARRPGAFLQYSETAALLRVSQRSAESYLFSVYISLFHTIHIVPNLLSYNPYEFSVRAHLLYVSTRTAVPELIKSSR